MCAKNRSAPFSFKIICYRDPGCTHVITPLWQLNKLHLFETLSSFSLFSTLMLPDVKKLLIYTCFLKDSTKPGLLTLSMYISQFIAAAFSGTAVRLQKKQNIINYIANTLVFQCMIVRTLDEVHLARPSDRPEQFILKGSTKYLVRKVSYRVLKVLNSPLADCGTFDDNASQSKATFPAFLAAITMNSPQQLQRNRTVKTVPCGRGLISQRCSLCILDAPQQQPGLYTGKGFRMQYATTSGTKISCTGSA